MLWSIGRSRPACSAWCESLSRQGVNPQRLDVDWGKIREDQRKQSVRDVRGSLILQYVAEKEKIDVQDEELDAEIERIATDANKPVEKIREVLGRDSGMARLRDQILNKKTLDFLQEHSPNSASHHGVIVSIDPRVHWPKNYVRPLTDIARNT